MARIVQLIGIIAVAVSALKLFPKQILCTFSVFRTDFSSQFSLPQLTLNDGQPIQSTRIAIITGADDPAHFEHNAIRGYQSALQFLQTSCHSMEKLAFRGHSFAAAQKDTISQSIGRHCGRHVLELDLQEAGNILVTTTANNFPRVRQLRLDYSDLPAHLQLHRIFPALQTLSVTALTESGHSSLLHLAAALPLMPQLRGLVVVGPANAILRPMQDALPNLQSLAIVYDEATPVNGSFRFPSVRHFALTTMGLSADRFGGRPFPLAFDRLETFDLFALGGTMDAAMAEWIGHNAGLRTVSSAFAFGDTEAMRFVAALGQLPKLRHVTMDVSGDVSVAYKLRHLGNVETVTFTTAALFRYTHDELLATVPSEWDVIDGWTDAEGGAGALTVARRRV